MQRQQRLGALVVGVRLAAGTTGITASRPSPGDAEAEVEEWSPVEWLVTGRGLSGA